MRIVAALAATPKGRVLAALLATALASSCTANSGPPLQLSNPSFAAAGGSATAATVVAEGDTDAAEAATTELPPQVAAIPEAKPAGAELPVQPAPEETPAVAEAAVAEDDQPSPAASPAQAAATAAADEMPSAASEKPVETAAVEVKPTAFIESGPGPAAPEAPKRKGFFSNLFASGPQASEAASSPGGAVPKKDRPQPVVAAAEPEAPTGPVAAPQAKPAPLIEKKTVETRALVQLASTGPQKPLVAFDGDALPGVRRQTALFEIKRRSGLDDDSDIDLHEDEGVQYAFAPGLARLAPNGLLKQTEKVDVACLKPSLVRILKTLEQYYGKKIVVTSGFRSPSYNKRVRGARNSQHMYCAAADVQMPGVSKWELAKFVRSMPGRGGVGTYCHTESVHVDVGPERDWNWRCKRRGA